MRDRSTPNTTLRHSFTRKPAFNRPPFASRWGFHGCMTYLCPWLLPASCLSSPPRLLFHFHFLSLSLTVCSLCTGHTTPPLSLSLSLPLPDCLLAVYRAHCRRLGSRGPSPLWSMGFTVKGWDQLGSMNNGRGGRGPPLSSTLSLGEIP